MESAMAKRRRTEGRIEHTPMRPLTPDPPTALVAIADTLTHPDVTRVGLTTTSTGEWALMVRIRLGRPTPIPEVEAHAGGYPVVYQDEPRSPPVARPAYPAKGE
jgi:hypothetical protein